MLLMLEIAELSCLSIREKKYCCYQRITNLKMNMKQRGWKRMEDKYTKTRVMCQILLLTMLLECK